MPTPRATHTVAILEVSSVAYEEIRIRLQAAGYDHAFMEDGEIDMSGLGLVPAPAEPGIFAPAYYTRDIGGSAGEVTYHHRPYSDYPDWVVSFATRAWGGLSVAGQTTLRPVSQAEMAKKLKHVTNAGHRHSKVGIDYARKGYNLAVAELEAANKERAS